jgi:hypothetical protein
MWVNAKWDDIKVDDIVRFETTTVVPKGRCKAVIVIDTEYVITKNLKTYMLVENVLTGDEYIWENNKKLQYQRWESNG